MNIAVLAWGSLVWDPRELAIDGSFMAGGPKLPLEFSRVSGDGRLTLVIDERVGVACATRVGKSKIDDLDEALTDLWKREGNGVDGAAGRCSCPWACWIRGHQVGRAER